MPDAPRGDLGSVEVHGGIDTLPGLRTYSPTDAQIINDGGPGRWRPLDADDALLGVVEAARAFVIAGDAFADSRQGDELADRRYVQAVADVGIALHNLALLDGGRREGASDA